LERAQARLAALVRRRRLYQFADGAGDGDRRIRLMDFTAQGRHRQQAGRFRICENRDVNSPVVPASEPGPIRRGPSMIKEGVGRLAATRGRGVWVPAFAGTT